MQFNTIYSLGTRCQNAMILKKFGYREFSGFFDYLNIHNIKNLIHILEDEFKTILDPKQNKILEYNGNIIDPETGIMANHALMTFNEFYDNNPLDTTFPHHNLFTEKDMTHFLTCIQRFRKLKNYNVLFNFTFNTWEWEKYNPDDYHKIH